MKRMENIAESTVETALSHGAETAEVALSEISEFKVDIRNNRIETLKESVSSEIQILLSVDKKRASVTSNDLSGESIRKLIKEGVELCRFTEKDKYYSLPDRKELGSTKSELEIFDSEILRLPPKRKIKIAKELEETAHKMDARIVTDTSSYSNVTGKRVLANSLGFCESYNQSYNVTSLSCAAEDNGNGKTPGRKQSSFWYSAAASFRRLDPVEITAAEAVKRTLRKLGSRKPKTCKVPIVFDPFTSSRFIAYLANAVRGNNIYKKASFLAGLVGETIAPSYITLIDDPLIRGKIGSRPFDGEGVISRKNNVVEKGILKTYLMDTYEANKLNSSTTGNSGGISNFYMVPGDYSEKELISSIDSGIYITSLSGQGANWSTGDFSQGAEGLWIENGKITYPVNGFTITGTFADMLKNIEMVADNIEWKSHVAAPSFKISNIVISGD
ncbi:MAG: TldD/PmbA family protein [Candidatus Krumholzibacteriota bacterium]|nr:TldD/PmbA family protein [Candidatus Krumholzibacteriota bacterium]